MPYFLEDILFSSLEPFIHSVFAINLTVQTKIFVPGPNRIHGPLTVIYRHLLNHSVGTEPQGVNEVTSAVLTSSWVITQPCLVLL